MLHALQKPDGAEGQGEGSAGGCQSHRPLPASSSPSPGPPSVSKPAREPHFKVGKRGEHVHVHSLGMLRRRLAVPGCCREQSEGPGGQQAPPGSLAAGHSCTLGQPLPQPRHGSQQPCEQRNRHEHIPRPSLLSTSDTVGITHPVPASTSAVALRSGRLLAPRALLSAQAAPQPPPQQPLNAT